MSVVNGTRITLKRTRPNPLFHDWLEELYEEAKAKGSKLEPMLEEALSSISKYPLPLQSGAECAILKGFDKRLCLFIDKRLDVYKSSSNEGSVDTCSKSSAVSASDDQNDVESNNIYIQLSSENAKIILSAISPEHNENHASNSSSSASTEDGKKKIYKPVFRSASYAFLMALIDLKKKQTMSKDQLIAAAQNYCEGDIISGWKSMTRLIRMGLVKKNNTRRFRLTDEGIAIANTLFYQVVQDKKVDDNVLNVIDFCNSTIEDLVKDKSNIKRETIDLLHDENECSEAIAINHLNAETITSDIVFNDISTIHDVIKDESNIKSETNYLLHNENECSEAIAINHSNAETITSDIVFNDYSAIHDVIKDESNIKSEINDLLYYETECSEAIAINHSNAKTITSDIALVEDESNIKSEIINLLYDENECSEAIALDESNAKTIITDDLLQDDNIKSERNDLLYDENIYSNETVDINDTKPIPHIKTVPTNNTPINGTRLLMRDNCTNSEVIVNVANHVDYSNLIEMEAGSFDIILLIDKHETSGSTKRNDPTVTQFNKYPELKHEYRSLKVGDFTWIARHKRNRDKELVLPYVVERKRMDDLGHSMKDGRFHEQKFRLRKCGLNHVIYMVENHGSNKHVGLPMQSLMQALANTRVQDGFKVHVTESLGHSVRFLATMTLRLMYEYKDQRLIGHNGEPKLDILTTFEYFNKSSVKNRALSVTDTFIKLLIQLKGVSVEKALAITNVYKTPRMLIERYKDCDQKEGEMLLANLKFGELNRSVGPSVSKSVYQLFTFRNMK